jgi:chromosomal replication initiator protein
VTESQAISEALEMDRIVSADSIAQTWESIRSGLRRDCGVRTFDGWLRPISLGGYDSDSRTLRLELPSQFMADWVQTHFAERLALAWRSAIPAIRELVISAGGDAPRTIKSGEISRTRCRSRIGRRGQWALRSAPRAALPLREFRRRQGE